MDNTPQSWNENWDLTTIPVDLFRSEFSRRAQSKRKNHSGGVIWAEHNPNTPRCRCSDCTVARFEQKVEQAGRRKRKPGRPPKEAAA